MIKNKSGIIPHPDFKTLFESVPGLYLVLDPDLYIVAVSDAYAKATMTQRNQILGRHIFEIFPDNPNDPAADGVHNLKKSLKQVIENKIPDAMPVQKYDIRKPASEGGEFEVRYWSPLNSPVLKEDNTLAYIIHRVEDVTDFVYLKKKGHEQKELAQELKDRMVGMEAEIYMRAKEILEANENLKKEKEKADDANRTKDLFLATMSHEIRTPLSALFGMLELLDTTTLDENQKEILGLARNSGNSLLRILNDILDWSKIESGKMRLSPQAVSIEKILSDIVSAHSQGAYLKGVRFCYQVDEHIGHAHIADPLRLSQILNDFVSNAIKFTQAGEIEVRAELIEANLESEKIQFSVRDTGIGISQEEQAGLFKRYAQATVHTARMYGGTGLGLAICRRLADLMDGVVMLESTPGEGSIFSFIVTLPTAVQEPSRENVSENVPDQSQLMRFTGSRVPRILVVDDHAVNLELLIRQLKQLGIQVEGADHGETGLKLWQEKEFDMVITDCHMPVMDGYEFTKKIRQIEIKEGRMRIPVLACTANTHSEEHENCYKSGMDEVIIKPTNTARLREIIGNYFSSTTDKPEIGTKVLSSSNPCYTKLPIDHKTLEETIPELDGQMELLKKFQKHQRKDLSHLLQNINEDNLEKIARISHRLKGASLMVAAGELSDVYSRIEQAAKNGSSSEIRDLVRYLTTAINRFDTSLFLFLKDFNKNKLTKKSGISDLGFLVIDDDHFQRDALINTLKSMGVTKIIDAMNGRQALERLQSSDAGWIDIILCDLDMPEMDGMEFFRRLGNIYSRKSIIIVSALSSALIGSVKKMVNAYGLSLLGAIEKPVSRHKLEELISAYASRKFPAKPAKKREAESFNLDEILHGLQQQQFEPFFQPKIDLANGDVVGAEALARWMHPERGIISPASFIAPLEESGNIDLLTFVILEHAAKACSLLHKQGHHLTISVNLSLKSLTDIDLADKITQIVRDAGVDPKNITLEITESAAMTDVAPALENLARLRMRGFGLSIDDYGTGYSSMQQIVRIAFSELKIDQSFVKEFSESDVSKIVVDSSIDMARKLCIASTAEGVETRQDFDLLKDMGCNMAQGYFIARPMDASSLIEFCVSGWSGMGQESPAENSSGLLAQPRPIS